jgi:hypothetical protein
MIKLIINFFSRVLYFIYIFNVVIPVCGIIYDKKNEVFWWFMLIVMLIYSLYLLFLNTTKTNIRIQKMNRNNIKPKHLSNVKYWLQNSKCFTGIYNEEYDSFITNDLYTYRKDIVSWIYT